MAKEIKINKDKIEIFKDQQLSFSTNYLYLKTDPNGVLRAGGYERCPVLTGYGTIADNTTYGGFPAVADIGVYHAFTLYLPKGATPTIGLARPWNGYIPLRNVVSPAIDVTNENGTVVGTFQWSSSVWGIYDGASAGPRPIDGGMSIVNLNIYGNVSKGAALYFRKSTDTTWTNMRTNPPSATTITLSSLDGSNQNVYAGYTVPSASLSLAVTP